MSKSVSYPQQTVSSFSPTSGAVGTVVTIKGSGFTGSNSAWAGSAHDAGLTIVSDTQARVVIPADASSGAIAILNPVHAAFTPSAFSVTANASAPPQQLIQSFSPTAGAIGTVVLLTGSGFLGSTAAWIGTAHDAALKVLSDTQAQITIPADGVTGQLAIFNAVHAAFAGSPFTVSGVTPSMPQPTISGFSPSSGSVGSVITVAGSGFSGANVAWVGNGHDASLTVLSDTQAKINVPGDATSGPIAIINAMHSTTSGGSFNVAATTPTPAPVPAPTPTALSLRVQGNHFIDAKGNVLQLRGASFSGYESVAIQGWDAADPSGAQAGQAAGPKWAALQSWKANVIRFPLNEASWLGYSCTDTSGVVHNPDPGGNYKSFVQNQVSQAVAAGLYVIIDLHWAAPGTACPMLQSQMADADHSLAFWTSVANTFKGNPAVAFELFNEPFLNFDFAGDPWAYMMKGVGGPFSGFPATSGAGLWKDVKQTWNIASYQQMITTVRATGATNVVMVGSLSYSQDLSGWLANRPADPLNQMAAVWHAYPTFGTTWGTAAYAQPNFSPAIFTNLQSILDAGIPIVATETGDRNSAGTQGAPLVSTVTAWADLHGISMLGWGWDIWGEADNVLIKDVNGTPTDGYGQVFKQWLLAH